MSILYQRLMIKSTASQDEVRRAYHKLALKYHPDRNQGDKAAEAHFKDLVSAFEILGDRKMRALYDQGRIDENGRPRQRSKTEKNQTFMWTDAAAAFQEAFEQRSSDLRAGSKSDTGSKASFQSSAFERGANEECYSKRKSHKDHQDLERAHDEKQYRLSIDFVEACVGTVKHVRLPNKAQFKITVPAGVETGQRLRVKSAGVNGQPFVVKITVEPHPVFEREASDIFLEVPLTPYEAYFGIELDVPTIHGPAKLTVPAQSHDNDEIVMRDMGIRVKGGVRAKGVAFGDQIVNVRVVMPRSWSDEAAKAMELWRQTSPFNPRGKLLTMLAK